MMRLERIVFRNFKALDAAELSLGRFTLIVGPNGSGKSTVIHALGAAAEIENVDIPAVGTAWKQPVETIEVELRWADSGSDLVVMGSQVVVLTSWSLDSRRQTFSGPEGQVLPESDKRVQRVKERLARIRAYTLNPGTIARPVRIEPNAEMRADGSNLAGVLDNLKDQEPERFEALNTEFSKWIPEFDRIVFSTVAKGEKALGLRTRDGRHTLPAEVLSAGTLMSLAILTLAHLPSPPSVLCLEDPDRGIHARLLPRLQEALYRLTHPEQFGEHRDPVQVIATTHSPYLLDLYRDHHDEVVIANREGRSVSFRRLSEEPDLREILGDGPLGEAWYSGILGGIPDDE